MSKYYIPSVRSVCKMTDSEATLWVDIASRLEDSLIEDTATRDSVIEYIQQKVNHRNEQNPRCSKLVVTVLESSAWDTNIQVCRTSRAKGCTSGVASTLFNVKILGFRRILSGPLSDKEGGKDE